VSFELAILDELSAGGYRGSVISTFNVYFPFYEEIVLRKLVAAGCRTNVLMVDRSQFAECMSNEWSSPKRAGQEYVLIPLKAPQTFHPKVALLGGPRKGCLLVGSHNMTIAGFGKNRELTNRIRVSDDKDEEGIYLARTAWDFFRKWVNAVPLPVEYSNSVLNLNNQIPWLNSVGAANDTVSFYGSTPTGPTLLDQIVERLPNSCTQICGVAPFLDQRFKFLATLHKRFPEAKLTIGVDPKTVQIGRGPWPDYCDFVDATELGAGKGYLHAKALFFRGAGADDVLVSGSANLTCAAWDAPPNSRNVEAVIVRTGPQARENADALGLINLADLPELDKHAREIIEGNRKESFNSDHASTNFALAVTTGSGIRLELAGLEIMAGDQIQLFTGKWRPVQHEPILIKQATETFLEIPLDSDSIRSSVFLKVIRGEDKQVVLRAIVLNTNAIRRRSSTGNVGRFLDAIASLTGDAPNLDEVVRLVQEIALSEEGHESVSASPRGHRSNRAQTGRPQKRRLYVTGGLSEVIDVLIYQLGTESEYRDEGGRDEEEQLDVDHESPDKDSAESGIDASFSRQFQELVLYRESHGNCLVPPYGYRGLGAWVTNLRARRRKRELTKDQIRRLDEIEFDWDPVNTKFDRRFQELVAYKKEHGDCVIPKEWPDNQELARWANEVQQGRRELTEDQARRLDEIEFNWDPVANTTKRIEIFHLKVKRMISRLLLHLRSAKHRELSVNQTLLKVLAVLATLHSLRSGEREVFKALGHETEEQQLLLKNLTLVPKSGRYEMFEGVVKWLHGTVEELEEAGIDQFERLLGLLTWLAYDSGVKLTKENPFNESPGEVTERIFQKALLLCVLSRACHEAVALDEAHKRIQGLAEQDDRRKAFAWLERQKEWIKKLEAVAKRKAKDTKYEDLEPGDVVCLLADPAKLRVVKSAQREKLKLIAPEKEQGTVTYLSNRLGIVETGTVL